MRFVMMVLGLGMLALAGLWFFTSALDPIYSRHVPQIAHARTFGGGSATTSSRPVGTASSPQASKSAPQAAGSAVGSKAITDNFMSMINVGAGLAGAYFTYMSYRLQQRQGRRRE